MRPALHAKKLRDLELRAGEPARRGQRGAAYAYNRRELVVSQGGEPKRSDLVPPCGVKADHGKSLPPL